MFGAIKIAMVMTVLATASMGFLYVKKLQGDLETARENVAKMEVAVQISEASIATLQRDVVRNAELSATCKKNYKQQKSTEMNFVLLCKNTT